MNVKRIYEYALKREQDGVEFFQKNAEKVLHAAAKDVFQKLAQEEMGHVKYIQKLLESKDLENLVSEISNLPEDDLFSARFSQEKMDQTVIESMIPDVTILRTAYLIERDFAEFYEMASKKVSGPAEQALKALAAWERRHEKMFQELHDRVFEAYTQMPWGG